MSNRAKRAMREIARRARQLCILLTFVVYSPLAPLGYFTFAAFCTIGPGDPVRRARRTQRIMAGAYRFLHDWMRWMRIVRFDHRGALEGIPPGPCVVVANHPTLMDVTAISAALGGGCTIAKPSLYRRRSLNPLLVGAGHIEGPGDDPAGVGRVIGTAVERLHQGFSVIVFPEGTRSPSGELLRFGRAAFEIACRARVPVLSVAIRCEPLWLSKDRPLFDPPHPAPHLELVHLATDDPARVSYDSRLLLRAVEGRFRSWHAGAATVRPVAVSPSLSAKDSPCPTSSKTA